MKQGSKSNYISAVVNKNIILQIDSLAKVNKVTRSTMTAELLQEILEIKANQQENTKYSKLEEKITKMDERLASLLVKFGRIDAQALFLVLRLLQMTGLDKASVDKVWSESLVFAGNVLKKPLKASLSDNKS